MSNANNIFILKACATIFRALALKVRPRPLARPRPCLSGRLSSQPILRLVPRVGVHPDRLKAKLLDLNLTSHLDKIIRGKIEQTRRSERAAELESEAWQPPPLECTPGLAMDCFIARSQVNGLVEIDLV